MSPDNTHELHAASRILFVCLGNICRSPAAEIVTKALIERHRLTPPTGGSFHIDSAGTASYHIGSIPDRRTCHEASIRGMVVDHRARQIGPADFHEFDLILAMDRSNLGNLHKIRPTDATAHVALFGPFADGAGSMAEVPDPYYDDQPAFAACFDQCEAAARGLLSKICGQVL